MTTFALVHGGWHGAWCWERLAPLLRRAGHQVVAVDLPSDDPTAGFAGYAELVCAALADRDDDVVVVGHSLAGHIIPLVAARRAVRHLVYLCAIVPAIGRSLGDQLAGETGMMCPGWDAALSERDEWSRTSWVDPVLTREILYADCDEPTVAAALKRLRPQANCRLTPFPLAAFPDVGSTYVVCSEDRMVAPDWGRRVARDRLGAELVELPGGHSPFLSRPRALAEVLLGCAAR